MSSAVYLHDTDHVSYLLDGEHPSVARRYGHIPNHQLAIAVMTEADLVFGARAFPLDHPRRHQIFELRTFIEILPWTSQAAHAFADIRFSLTRAASTIGDLDMMIAAQAISANLILVSNNIGHFSRKRPSAPPGKLDGLGDHPPSHLSPPRRPPLCRHLGRRGLDRSPAAHPRRKRPPPQRARRRYLRHPHQPQRSAAKNPRPTRPSSPISAHALPSPSTAPPWTPEPTPRLTARASKKPPATSATPPSVSSCTLERPPTSSPPTPSTTRPKPFSPSSSAAPGSKASPPSRQPSIKEKFSAPSCRYPARRSPHLPRKPEPALARRLLEPRPVLHPQPPSPHHPAAPSPGEPPTRSDALESSRARTRRRVALGHRTRAPPASAPAARQTRPRRWPQQLGQGKPSRSSSTACARSTPPCAAASSAPPPPSSAAGSPLPKPPACSPWPASPPTRPTPPFPPDPAPVSSFPPRSSPSAAPASSACPAPEARSGRHPGAPHLASAMWAPPSQSNPPHRNLVSVRTRLRIIPNQSAFSTP